MTEETIAQALKTAWHRFIDETSPYRGDLFRYCRNLAGNVWDAEDLVQDTLTRAFGRWGMTIPAVDNPRAYLMRVAANVWIDEIRRRQAPTVEVEAIATDPDPVEVREAGQRLLHRLSPQEQAALVMKETFDMTAKEIAATIGTTEGAVKAALHRGRKRLAAPESEVRRDVPSRELVERFSRLFEARDLDGLAEMFAASGTAENIGNSWHIGDGPRGFRGVLYGCVMGHKEWPIEHQRKRHAVEVVEYEGELILLAMGVKDGIVGVASIYRLDEVDGRITRFRSYGFCQDLVDEVATHAGKLHNRGVYRAPTPAPGKDWD